MLDLRFVRENPEIVNQNIRNKFQDSKLPLVDEVIALDAENRAAKKEADDLRAGKNKIAKQIGALMAQGKKEEAEELKKKVGEDAARLAELEEKEKDLSERITKIMMTIPNIIDPSVPIGKDDSENVEVQKYGEAGAVASAYALIISALIYKTLGWKKLWGIIKKSAANTATLALLCGTSMLFSYIISLEQVPRVVASLVMGITDNKYIFLFIVNIVFLLLGCVLDVSTIQLVFVPMVLPLVQAMGIDLVHFGVVICLNMMIGLSTPPFGMLLFIVSGLGKTKIKGVIREILPMVLIMIGLLFLVTYVPDIIMFIPNNFM